ncbi:MAG: hypothetical protein H6664_14390 [Ardenticatenaceae bacterium]|nr:hypothetical protein [Ardenticatenaceae bacterium]MCB9005559.1 hypothetical protein [Ardenticatenaceae bacterium]
MTSFIWLSTLLQTISDPNQFNGYLVLGYVVMWLIGLVYVVSLITRQRNLQQDIQLMQRLLEEDEMADSDKLANS